MSEENLSTNEIQIKSQLSSDSDKPLAVNSVDVISKISEVNRRNKALKKLQFEKLKLDGEVEQLILSKFHDKYETIYQKRAQILNGSHRPTDEECDFKDNDSDPNIEESMEDQKDVFEPIHDFWFVSLLSYPFIRNWISGADQLVLQNLKDIRVVYNENPPKLVFEFHFEPNQYFTNEVLRKQYELNFGVAPDNLFRWNALPFYPIKREGCSIDWKEGTRIGRKMKALQNLGKDTSDYFLSFFDFFSPPQEKGEEDSDESLREQLAEDWQIAITIYKEFVPNAILYYTGQLCDED